ncbi:MAG: hypothetical protein WDN66_00250 [Candidatus Saccharibacteria bacterium]
MKIAVLDRLEEGEEEKLRPQIEENLGKVTLLEVLQKAPVQSTLQ